MAIKKPIPEPFRVSTYIEPDDLLDHEDAEGWSHDQAEAFLKKHEGAIREAMSAAALEAIEDLLTPVQTYLTLDD